MRSSILYKAFALGPAGVSGYTGQHLLTLMLLYLLLLVLTPIVVGGLPLAPGRELAVHIAMPAVPPLPEVEESSLIVHRVEFTETLAQIFRLSRLDTGQLFQLLDSPAGSTLNKITEGDMIEIEPDGQGGFNSLTLERNALERVRVERRPNGLYDIIRQRRQPEEADAVATFARSPRALQDDAASAGLSPELLEQVSTLLGWSVDLALDSRVGDRFILLYKRLYLDGVPVGYGPVTALEWRGEDRIHRIFRYRLSGTGEYDYYAEDGANIQKAFLRTPLKNFIRISSPYDLKRKHPVLHRVRAHTGVDYAAPIGTEVRATGRGVVTYARVAQGYGNLVTIDHRNNHETRYGHLNSFGQGITQGRRVEQGDVIGYVGATGDATGPHLHYEFRIGTQHTDPMAVPLPNVPGIPSDERDLFEVMVRQKVAQLELVGGVETAEDE